MKRLLRYMANFKFHLLLALVLAISSNLLALVGPSLSGKAVDAIALGKGKVDFDTVWYYAGLMILFYVASAVLSYALSILMLRIAQRMAARMRQQVFDRLLSLPVSYFDRNQAGDIISRVSYDIDVISTSVSNDFVQVVAGLVTVIGSLVMMVIISPPLVVVMFFTAVDLLYTVYGKKDKADVSETFRQGRRVKRYGGRADYRSEDHPGLRKRTGHDGPV